MKPLEAFERALLFISGVWDRRFSNKPGTVIEKLNVEQREALSQLKSDDIGSEGYVNRWVMLSIADEDYHNKNLQQAIRDEKTLFDSKMKR